LEGTSVGHLVQPPCRSAKNIYEYQLPSAVSQVNASYKAFIKKMVKIYQIVRL